MLIFKIHGCCFVTQCSVSRRTDLSEICPRITVSKVAASTEQDREMPRVGIENLCNLLKVDSVPFS